jgi:hypothetical protein
MPDRDFEVRQLRLADRHIDRAVQIIADQQLEVGRLRLKGHDSELAERTLKAFEDSLQIMYEHRNSIIRVIEQIDRRLFRRPTR